MGTVELTGFEMMSRWALGQTLAAAFAKSRTMDAFVCEDDSKCQNALLAIRRQAEGPAYTGENLQAKAWEYMRWTHVEEVITSHAWLARNTGRNDNELSALQCLLKTIVLRSISGGLRRKVDR